MSRARTLRADRTEPERLLWMLLRDRRFAQYKFRRQVPLGDYVADFVCFNPRLAIELDGGQHMKTEQAAFDAQRTARLNEAGFHVVRIWNSDLYRERNAALTIIWNGLQEAPRGEKPIGH